VHYGTNYWETMLENRQSSISKKYAPGGSSKTQKHYAVEAKYGFKFFDGIVPDLNGSGLPALVLLQSIGETGACSEAFDIVASCAAKGLRIEDCPESHAAFPGKRLVADRDFSIGEEICIYAGVMSRMPEEQLKLNESDYISTVCNSACGPFGFELEDISAKSGCVFKKFQRDLPTLTPLTKQGLCIPNAHPPADLSRIEDIRGVGPECTQRLLAALQDASLRDVVGKLLKKLRSLPEKQWKISAQIEIKKALPPKKCELEKDKDPIKKDVPEYFLLPDELRSHLAFLRNKENSYPN
jgi:hypothetical protein